MKKTTKTISRTTYLKAMALFHMANSKYQSGKSYEDELSKLLKYDDTYMGHISDDIYDSRPDFNVALKKEGYTVRSPRK